MVLILVTMATLGCNIANPSLKKDSDGYFLAHYRACGPIALEKAINEYYFKNKILPARGLADRKDISRQIQDNGFASQRLLSLLNSKAINITWPSEIKDTLDKYGFDIIKVKSLSDLDKQKDVAVILIHGKFLSKEYHWLVYSIDNIKTYFGKNTVIDLIYLIKFRKKK